MDHCFARRTQIRCLINLVFPIYHVLSEVKEKKFDIQKPFEKK